MSTWIWLLLGLSLLIRKNEGGFGNPHEARAFLEKLTGTPCECHGGTWNGETTPLLNVDCGDKTAYLVMRQNIHGAQAWVCSKKAKIIPTSNNKPRPCPCIEFHPSVHNTCYEQVQLCTGTDNNTYFTAILTRHFLGTFGGEWDTVPQVQGTSNKYAQSGCPDTVGKTVCWNKTPPVHISDGGGPQDQASSHKSPERNLEACCLELIYTKAGLLGYLVT
ncbi:uncharacterized protein LOC128581123 [Nycticebus coucang]|uniref:uncharacterized protein LOC128581123 n=1 Tax=Nycticebus coucang TaxID=9470 RepID=UPI00234C19A9|nr:uncharacterized protein LOC128581123 [Nycticebus coucang]